MRPFTSTISLDEAMRIVMTSAVPIARTETIDLAEADRRVVAHEVRATRDVPPFDRAAMDGYAVVAADTAGATIGAPRRLACVGRVFPGDPAPRSIRAGECVEIATGAPMPNGADAVVMVEDTMREGDATIGIVVAVQPRQHVGARGADLAVGHLVVPEGQVLGPSQLGALAAVGMTSVDVWARPTVAILSTGDELVEPGRPLGPGQIYDINRVTISTVVTRHGGVAVGGPAVADTLDALVDAIGRVRHRDIVVLSGGSSVGDRDLLRDAIGQLGQLRFHGVAVKPGKPTAFGSIGSTPVFGMPGYPTSCLSNALLLLTPFLRKTARLPPWRPRTIDLPITRRIVSAAGRHQFYTVRIVDGRAEPAFKASGDITSLAHADGYIEIPADVDSVDVGSIVSVRLFEA